MPNPMPKIMVFLIVLFSILCVYIVYAQDMDILYEGIASDQRDYVIQYRAPGETLIIEDHFQLYPYSQWYNTNKPLYSQAPYATLKDWDGDGHNTEWWSHYGNKRYIWDWDFHIWKPKGTP